MAREYADIGPWKHKFKCLKCGSTDVELRTKPDGWVDSAGNHRADLSEIEDDQIQDGGRCLNPDCKHYWDEGEEPDEEEEKPL